MLPKYSRTCGIILEGCRHPRDHAFRSVSSSSRNYHLLVVSWCQIVCFTPFSLTEFLSNVALHRICICYHNHYEFICVDALMCPKDTLPFSTSQSQVPIHFCCFFHMDPWSLRGSCNIYTFSLDKSILQSLVLRTMAKLWEPVLNKSNCMGWNPHLVPLLAKSLWLGKL